MIDRQRDINDFTKEVECEYDGRKFRVRDNGAVLMLHKEDDYPILWDSRWTFGQLDNLTHSMVIGAYDVHKIVAEAFQLPNKRPHCIIDHIDGNKANNSVSNLRWITQAEKALGNPETREKVIKICGSVDAFLDNPALLHGHESENNDFYWMVNLTREEARGIGLPNRKQSIMSWLPVGWDFTGDLFRHIKRKYLQPKVKYIDISTPSLTPNAVQVDWKLPTEFPCCPQGVVDNPLQAYKQNLKRGAVFCKNKYYSSTVVDSAFSVKGTLLVMTTNPDSIKPWALAKITYENGRFVHINGGTYFEEDGANKYFTLEQGKEWIGKEELLNDCC